MLEPRWTGCEGPSSTGQGAQSESVAMSRAVVQPHGSGRAGLAGAGERGSDSGSREHIGPERSALLDRVIADQTPYRFFLSDWQKLEASLRSMIRESEEAA